MHFHIGLMEFIVFAMYYFVLKAILLLINVETRRNGLTVPAGVSGLLA
jgi:hypothetical protein